MALSTGSVYCTTILSSVTFQLIHQWLAGQLGARYRARHEGGRGMVAELESHVEPLLDRLSPLFYMPEGLAARRSGARLLSTSSISRRCTRWTSSSLPLLSFNAPNLRAGDWSWSPSSGKDAPTKRAPRTSSPEARLRQRPAPAEPRQPGRGVFTYRGVPLSGGPSRSVAEPGGSAGWAMATEQSPTRALQGIMRPVTKQ